MAIQPEEAQKRQQKALAEKYKHIINNIEAGIDKKIEEWDGYSIIKYHIDTKKLVYFVTSELTRLYHGWNVIFESDQDNKLTGWISLSTKIKHEEIAPFVPWSPGSPYKHREYPPKVTWEYKEFGGMERSSNETHI